MIPVGWASRFTFLPHCDAVQMSSTHAALSRLSSPSDPTTTNNLLSLLKQQMLVIEQISQAADQARLEIEETRLQLESVKGELENAKQETICTKNEADQAKYVATEAKSHAERAISIAKESEIQTKQARMEAKMAKKQAEQAMQDSLESRAGWDAAILQASKAELRAEEEASRVELLTQEVLSLRVASETAKNEANDARDFAQRIVQEAQKKQIGGEAFAPEEMRRLKRLLEKAREETIKAKNDVKSMKDALELDRKLAREQIERIRIESDTQVQGAKEKAENASFEASKAKAEAEVLRKEADKCRSELLRVQAQTKAELMRAQSISTEEFEGTLLKAKKEIKRAKAEAERARHETEKARADAECARMEISKMIHVKRASAEADTESTRECPENREDSETVEGLVAKYKSLKKQVEQKIWQQVKAEKQTRGPFPHLVDYRLSRYSEISKEWGL